MFLTKIFQGWFINVQGTSNLSQLQITELLVLGESKLLIIWLFKIVQDHKTAYD